MLFSIVTLTYKRLELLEESVYSVLQQTFKDWELIIINDCDSQSIWYNYPKIKIFNLKERFKTISDKRNFGLDNSQGDWVLQLDDDDFLLPSYLENLSKIINGVDWICWQKPIIYNSDVSKIYLSPVPQANTFLCNKKAYKTFRYSSSNSNEINSFYEIIDKNFKGIKRVKFLKPNECGHVWRHGVDERRKYSLTNLVEKNISQQYWNDEIQNLDNQSGKFVLNPKWDRDYNFIIQKNIKLVDPKFVFSRIKGGMDLLNIANDAINEYKRKGTIEELSSGSLSKQIIQEDPWQKVKPTWTNALKFIEAAKSRGVFSTALNVVGLKNNLGERVSDEILKQRQLSCFGDSSKNISKCPRLVINKNGSFCGGCGCGDKKIARLDPESSTDYTKLHYPYLECPLKRPGFSNEEISEYPNIPLSIIIPVLNDNEELNLTIKSIRETSPPSIEIIVIDDASDVPTIVDDKNVKLIRLEKRQGVGSTRHLGATMATTDYLLFVDSHMRFDKSWYKNSIKLLTSNPYNVVWCATCLGLEEGCMDLEKHRGAYCGAKLVLYNESQVFEGKWIEEKPENEYEITCLMGACYFFHKKWFFHIGGTKSLKMWGSDEPLLSAKTLLAGGSMRLTKDVKIGHKFRQYSPYSTGVSYIIYNKLRSMYMLFSTELYNELSKRIPDDNNKKEALKMLEQDINEIKKERQYYKTIFKRDEKWFLDYIGFKL